MKPWRTVQVLPAPRKWDRMFSEAVARSVVKTVTEPVTNSWDSYKRAGRLPPSSGIVEAFLKLNEGDAVSHDSLVSGIPRTRSVPIKVVVAITRTTSGLRKRECRVVDQAAGMDSDELRASLEYYGEEKGGQVSANVCRGLFGQGLSDVLFGHDDGRVISFKRGVIREVRASRGDNEQPKADLVVEQEATQLDRREWGVDVDGTCVSVLLKKVCHVPEAESLYQRLCNFYMLRLINADPACGVTIEQHRPGGKEIKQELSYNFPPGKVVGKFSVSWQFGNYPPILIEGIAVHATEPLRQNGAISKEEREGGFLVVDEADTVYDLTLFDFEKKPGLDHLYGIVRLRGARAVIRDLLGRPEAPMAVITDSRDGFDQRNSFARELWRVLHPLLKPIVDREAKLASESVSISEETDRRVRRAFAELNELFKRETEEGGVVDVDTPKPLVKGIAFDPPGPLTLTAGVPRRVNLIAEVESFGPQAEIILGVTTSEIAIVPDRVLIAPARSRKGRQVFPLQVFSSSLGAKGKVEALAEMRNKEDASAELVISSVKAPPILAAPPDGMEFRPGIASAPPHRKGTIFLFLDVDKIPLGSEVHVRMESSPSGLSLLTSDETMVKALPLVKVSPEHLVDGGNIARIAVHFRGQAKGQEGEVVAKAKGRDRHSYKCSAELRVRGPESDQTGVFSTTGYRYLRQKVASQFDEADGTIWLNSDHPLNRAIFGEDTQSFDEALKTSETAQLRLAEVVIEEAMYHILATKCMATGERGFKLDEKDPIGSVRGQIEKWKYEKGKDVFRALARGAVVREPTDSHD